MNKEFPRSLSVFFSPIGGGGMGVHGRHVLRALTKVGPTHCIVPHTIPSINCHLSSSSVVSNPLPSIWQKISNKVFPRPGIGVLKGCKNIGKQARLIMDSGGNFDFIYGFSGVALESFKRAYESGIPRILDHPNLHPLKFRNSYLSEHAKWVGSRPFYGNPTVEMVQRMEEEMELASLIRVNSALAKESLFENGVDVAKIKVLHQPLDDDLQFPINKKSRIDGELRICFVGSICLRKGFIYLLRAIRSLRNDKISIIFVGNTGDRECKKILLRESLGLHVEIKPGNPGPVFYQSDLLVLPSLEDGFGLVVTEAMRAGLPVIVTDMCGAKEIVEEGVNGWIVKEGDVEALAERLKWAVDHINLLPSIGANARRTSDGLTTEVHDFAFCQMVSEHILEKVRK